MSKEKKQLLNKNNDKEELDINGNPIDPNRKYIGNKVKVPMASPNHPIYKTSATIILRGKPITEKQKKLKKDTVPKKINEFDKVITRKDKPTGYMNIDVKGKVKELKALTRKERLDLARFKNTQKARRK